MRLRAVDITHFLCLSFLTYIVQLTRSNYTVRLDVAWPPIGLQRSTALKQMMGQDEFSLHIASYQSQAPTQNRGCQASI